MASATRPSPNAWAGTWLRCVSGAGVALHGRPGLFSRIGRPATGVLSSFPAPVRQALESWRQQHPGWGPDTLLAEARKAADLVDQRLPKRATLAHWRKELHVTRSYQRHAELPQPAADAPQAAHAAWEMDAYGAVAVPQVGMISLINLNDCFSRVKVLSFPCWVGDQRVTRHPDTPDYL